MKSIVKAALERYLRSKAMIGLDTNVLLRYFVEDDLEQAREGDALRGRAMHE